MFVLILNKYVYNQNEHYVQHVAYMALHGIFQLDY
jgi:hypothetical protein